MGYPQNHTGTKKPDTELPGRCEASVAECVYHLGKLKKVFRAVEVLREAGVMSAEVKAKLAHTIIGDVNKVEERLKDLAQELHSVWIE